MRDGALGRLLDYEDRALMCVIGAFKKRGPRKLASPFYHGRMQQEGTVYEEVGSHQTANLLAS